MATIIPFPSAMPISPRGLTKQECHVLDAEAAGLIRDGQATGISVHNDGQYCCVYDSREDRYFIGREEGICYLFDDNEKMLAKSPRFEIILQALEVILKSSENAQA